MRISVLNGVWSGIAGIVITLGTTTEIIKEFRFQWREKEVKPLKDGGADDLCRPLIRKKSL